MTLVFCLSFTMRIGRGVVWGPLTGHSDEAKYVHTDVCMRVKCFVVVVVETQRRVWVLFTTNVLCYAGGDIIYTVHGEFTGIWHMLS